MPARAESSHAIDEELIDVSCPKCRQPFSVREQFAGSDVPCPMCNTPLSVAPRHDTAKLAATTESVLKELAEDFSEPEPAKKSGTLRAAKSPRAKRSGNSAGARGRDSRGRQAAGISPVALSAIAGMTLLACVLIWKMTSRDETTATSVVSEKANSASETATVDAPKKELEQNSRPIPQTAPAKMIETKRAELPAISDKAAEVPAPKAVTEIPSPTEPAAAPTSPPAAPSTAPAINEPGFPERKSTKVVDDIDDRDAAAMKKKIEHDGEAANKSGAMNPFKHDESKAQEPAAKGPKPAAEPAKIAAAIPGLCPQCCGTRFLPILPGKPYVWMDGAANPADALPWKWCSRCQKNADANQLLQQETARIANHTIRHQELTQGTHLDLVQAETPQITLQAQLPVAQTKQVAQALEELRLHLQRVSGTTVLTPTRPDTHEIIILRDSGSYNAYMDLLAAKYPGTDFSLARKCSGSSGRTSSFYNASLGVPHVPPPEHMALFMLGQMFMREATDGKAPAWLVEGFAAYGENIVTKKNLCYSFAYEMNEVKFGMNWNADIKKFAKDGKLKPWKQVFPLELVGMKSLDYLTCYSVVCFLMNDPHRFVNFVNEIRAGVNSDAALEKAYGQKVDNLQSTWAVWTMTVK